MSIYVKVWLSPYKHFKHMLSEQNNVFKEWIRLFFPFSIEDLCTDSGPKEKWYKIYMAFVSVSSQHRRMNHFCTDGKSSSYRIKLLECEHWLASVNTLKFSLSEFMPFNLINLYYLQQKINPGFLWALHVSIGKNKKDNLNMLQMYLVFANCEWRKMIKITRQTILSSINN